MPVARILTRSPHEAEPVAAQLRARGYTVEIAAPDVHQPGAVEVEISLECCDADDALARAAELATGDLDVFVARGTFAGARPVMPQADSRSVELAPALPLSPAPESEWGRRLRHAGEAAGAAAVRLFRASRELTLAALAVTRAFGHRLQSRMAARQQRRAAVHHRRRRSAARPNVMAAAPRRAAAKPRPPERLPVIRRTRSREREWKAAGIFSVGLAAAITLGWAAANRRPAEPVPASVLLRSNSVQQQVPFGPVTLPAPVVPTSQALAESADRPITAGTHSGNDVGNTGDEVAVRHFTRPPKPAVHAKRKPKDELGDEVVVRHFTPAAADHTPRPEPAVKRTVVND